MAAIPNAHLPPGRKRTAIFAVHGISPHQRYACLDQTATALQLYLNTKEQAARSGHVWDSVVHWPRVEAQDSDTVRPSALRIHRTDHKPDDPDAITYDVYEGYWSPLSKGRTNFASAMSWILKSSFLATSSTANIPCTWQKLKSDLTYVGVLLGIVLAASLAAVAVGLSAWAAFIRAFPAPGSASVSYGTLLMNPASALRLPVLAYVELCIDAAAAYVLAQLAVMHYVGSRREKRTTKRMEEFPTRPQGAKSHFRDATISARAFHRYASVLLWVVFVALVLAAVGIDRLAMPVALPHAGATALVVVSVLLLQVARSTADFAVENVLGDVQVYTTHDQNSGYYAIREQIVQTVSDALLAVLRATDTPRSAQSTPYYDSIHIFGHSLGSTIAMDVLIRLRQLLQEQTLPDAQWMRIRSLTTFGTALEKTRFLFDVRHPTLSAAQDQWENDVYGRYFTRDKAVMYDPDNARGIYWSNLWYFRDIVANEIASYRSDVSPGPSFEWAAARVPKEICANHMLPHPRWRFAWVHSDYLQDQGFWDTVGPIVA